MGTRSRPVLVDAGGDNSAGHREAECRGATKLVLEVIDESHVAQVHLECAYFFLFFTNMSVLYFGLD